jgi:serine/threonine protein kinase
MPTSLCPACGNSVSTGANACGNCGRRLASRRLRPGQTLLNGVYIIVRPLTEGGVGILYLAADRNTFDRTVVIKAVLDPSLDPNDPAYREAQANFKREAETLTSLNHPLIPKIFAYFHDGPNSYIVMEYIKGRDLEHQLTLWDNNHKRIPGHPYPLETVIRWGIELCGILIYLAQPGISVVHHDIKPANILLDESGDYIRLVDFGAAKVLPSSPSGARIVPRKSSVWGTPGYAPIEQIQRRSEARTDVYALAATLYHLATDDDPRERMPPDPRNTTAQFQLLGKLGGLSDVLRRALHPDVEQRPSAAELRDQLRALLTPAFQTPAPTRTVQSPAELAQWCESNWRHAATWLYERKTLPEQIEGLWGKTNLADQVRAAVSAHHDDHNAGVDAVLQLLDPTGFGAAQPKLRAKPPQIDYGPLAELSQSEQRLKIENIGRRYVSEQLVLPSWIATPTAKIALAPGEQIDIRLIADMGAVGLGGKLHALAQVSTLALPVAATVSPWRTFAARLALVVRQLGAALMALLRRVGKVFTWLGKGLLTMVGALLAALVTLIGALNVSAAFGGAVAGALVGGVGWFLLGRVEAWFPSLFAGRLTELAVRIGVMLAHPFTRDSFTPESGWSYARMLGLGAALLYGACGLVVGSLTQKRWGDGLGGTTGAAFAGGVGGCLLGFPVGLAAWVVVLILGLFGVTEALSLGMILQVVFALGAIGMALGVIINEF